MSDDRGDRPLSAEHTFVRGLDPNPANRVPLTPISFLERSALIWPDKVAVRHGRLAFTYRELEARCRRLASALAGRGVRRGDTVAVMAPNIPALLEAHYAVPALGAILNAINYRIEANAVAFCLDHGEAKVLLTDAEFAPIVKAALAVTKRDLLVVDIADPEGPEGESLGSTTYEALLAEGDPAFAWPGPCDEWDSLSLLYTSGTTGDPKGVVYHHRGAYLQALSSALAFGLTPAAVYLWTLPMFHCNGWSYTWAVTAVGGVHVCLRRVEPALIFAAIRDHRVTHMCGAPVVLNMLIHAPDTVKVAFDHTVEVATGGNPPPSAVFEAIERMGFRVNHMYGLTETYAPVALCVRQDAWAALAPPDRARQLTRQGVPMLTITQLMVADPKTHVAVPRDGKTMGEVMLRGNTVMKGYLKNERATDAAFANGWFHTGDLAVWHPDNYMEMKDRSKDIIISGGENITSAEIEECLYRHPQIMEAAVVGRPDPVWGETPCAFVTLKLGADGVTGADIIAWCRDHIAHFKAPKAVVFGPLPKTATGKIQKHLLRERAKNRTGE
jgi:fatty-acyl-CoA synthase